MLVSLGKCLDACRRDSVLHCVLTVAVTVERALHVLLLLPRAGVRLNSASRETLQLVRAGRSLCGTREVRSSRERVTGLAALTRRRALVSFVCVLGACCAMGNAVGAVGLTEEQLVQLLRDTQLDRTTATALAEIYTSATPGSNTSSPAGNRRHSVGGPSAALGASQRKSGAPLAFMNTLRGSPKVGPKHPHGDAAGGPPPAVELTKEQFVKLLEDGGIAQGEAAQKMFVLFDEDGWGRCRSHSHTNARNLTV